MFEKRPADAVTKSLHPLLHRPHCVAAIMARLAAKVGTDSATALQAHPAPIHHGWMEASLFGESCF